MESSAICDRMRAARVKWEDLQHDTETCYGVWFRASGTKGQKAERRCSDVSLGVTRMAKIRNECLRGLSSEETKIRLRLRWTGDVQRRDTSTGRRRFMDGHAEV